MALLLYVLHMHNVHHLQPTMHAPPPWAHGLKGCHKSRMNRWCQSYAACTHAPCELRPTDAGVEKVFKATSLHGTKSGWCRWSARGRRCWGSRPPTYFSMPMWQWWTGGRRAADGGSIREERQVRLPRFTPAWHQHRHRQRPLSVRAEVKETSSNHAGCWEQACG